ncbi:MAG: hypothetical protein LBK99_10290, partial [Opitutaceae bacterium]|nr:hypothetical protein [Opitutaceae bacterium]
FVLPPDQALEGARVTVKNGKTFGTVSVVSIDGKPLEESGRLLVMHLTDALPTGMRFAHQDRRLLEARGRSPHLAEAGIVEIGLRLDVSGAWRAWVVDATGKRQREATLVRQGDAWVLSARTVTDNGTCFAYEIVVE